MCDGLSAHAKLAHRGSIAETKLKMTELIAIRIPSLEFLRMRSSLAIMIFINDVCLVTHRTAITCISSHHLIISQHSP